MMRIKRRSSLTCMAVLCMMVSLPAVSDTLGEVRNRDRLICGTALSFPGFAFTDNQGETRGFDVDFCRALAAAVLGDPRKIELKPLAPRDAFPQLQNGAVDILTARFSWTYNRDNGSGMSFTAVTFHDGQGFMVRKAAGLTAVEQLSGASICVGQGTTTELNLADYFRAHGLKYRIVSFADIEEARHAYETGRCDAWSADRASLAVRRTAMRRAEEHVVLPETISQEPTGPMVRKSDPKWEDIVRWTIFALIDAEQLGITQASLEQMHKTSGNPEVRRLLGAGYDLGQKNGLSAHWAFDAISAVGNYGEIFGRNLGPATPIGLPRGLNALWRDGGLLMAPPFR